MTEKKLRQIIREEYYKHLLEWDVTGPFKQFEEAHRQACVQIIEGARKYTKIMRAIEAMDISPEITERVRRTIQTGERTENQWIHIQDDLMALSRMLEKLDQ